MKIRIPWILLIFLFIFQSGCGYIQTSTLDQSEVKTPISTLDLTTPIFQNATSAPSTIFSDNNIVFSEGYGEGFVYENSDNPKIFNFLSQNNYIDFIITDETQNNLIGLSSLGYVEINDCFKSQHWVYRFSEIGVETNSWLFPPLLSPDHQKIAYIMGSGQYFEGMLTSGYEFQDLVIQNVENNKEVIQLTQNGGARQITSYRYGNMLSVWSPDSNWIVYSDFDNNGIYQLYVSRIDGKEKYQLTHRSPVIKDLIAFNYSVAWAPSGTLLAISYFNEDQITSIIRLNDNTTISSMDNSYPLWWVDNNYLLLYNYSTRIIEIFNPTTNQISPQIGEIDYPFSMIEPYGNRIGLVILNINQPIPPIPISLYMIWRTKHWS